jgi:hypothetical protein
VAIVDVVDDVGDVINADEAGGPSILAAVTDVTV